LGINRSVHKQNTSVGAAVIGSNTQISLDLLRVVSKNTLFLPLGEIRKDASTELFTLHLKSKTTPNPRHSMGTPEPELYHTTRTTTQSAQSIHLNTAFVSATTPFTLITGASRGIGRALAIECARANMHLILVALPGEGLENVKATIQQQFAVQVHTCETDLTLPDAPQALYQWCSDRNLTVNVLINNAGIGQQGAFEDLELSRKLFLMNLNMNVPVSLIHCFLPMLRTQPASYLMNVGSVAAFAPIPYKSLYSASKAFVLTLTRALRFELTDTSVTVSCLCPGPTLTNPQNQQNARSIGKRGTLFEVQPDVVARHAIREMLAGTEVIVPGWKHQFVSFFSRYLPKAMTIPYSGRMFAASRKALLNKVEG
jgi:uncharacterized protein